MIDPNARITELESRLAFQEDAIAALNSELAVHVQMMRDMETQLRHLHRKLEEVRTTADAASLPGELEPPPPHY